MTELPESWVRALEHSKAGAEARKRQAEREQPVDWDASIARVKRMLRKMYRNGGMKE